MDQFSAEQGVGPNPSVLFEEKINALKPQSVLEIGTLQSIDGRSTHSQALFSHVERKNYVMGDVIDGRDVDVVCDLHNLPENWRDRFDVFIARAVFEHLERPWIAAAQINKVLAPGGLCYVATHQTFPLHGFPNDFFRFSKAALELIFKDAGLDILACRYEHRCKIVPPPEILEEGIIEAWNNNHPSYIIVHLLAQKPVEVEM